MKEGTALTITSQQPGNKKVIETITYANPAASDTNLKKFAVGMYDLSENKLVNVRRVQTDDIYVADD